MSENKKAEVVKDVSPRPLFPHKPLGGMVVVEMEAAPKITESGIQLPDTMKQLSNKGLVVAAGPGRIGGNGQREPMEVEIGDRVLVQAARVEIFTIDDREFAILHQHQVLMVLNAN